MKKTTLSLIALLILSTFLINCGGGSGGSSSPGGEKPGVPEIVQVLPSHYIAMTNSAILIRAKILNGNGGPVKNLPVTFTNISPIGTLMSNNDALLGNKTVVKTNDSGMATIKVKSTTSGFVTIQAEVNKGVGVVRDRKTMYFSSSLSSSPFMYLDADADSDLTYNEPSDYTLFESNNASDNQVLMRATVYNKFGQRVFGSTVQFGADFPYKVGSSTTCSDGTSSCSVTFPNGNSATTNSSGEAFVLVQVDPVVRNIITILNITAVADNGAANVYSLFLEPIIISSVTVTANPSIVAPAGTSTISAAVRLNTGGVPPNGTAVGFVADCGTVTPFALTTTGLATATFTAPSAAPSPPVCRVTATVEGISNYADITISSALTVQPPTQSINGLTGGTVSYIISGGVPAYTVTSSNRFAACNSTDNVCTDATDTGTWNVTTPDASGSFIFTVTVPAGTAAQSITLSVRDSVGATVSATLTIGGGGALSVQPGTVSVNGDTPPAAGVTFTIFGGAPPYDVFPNNADPAFTPTPTHVTASGGTFNVTVPPSTPAITVVYTVRDSAAATTTATLNITATTPTPAALLIIPGSQSVVAPGTATYTVSGGTAPYVITSTDPSSACNSTDADCIDAGDSGIWNLAAAGSFTVTVPSTAVAGNVTLNIFDSVGATKSATLTIVSGGAATGITINPASISVTGLAGATDNVTFTIIGGTSPYTVFSTNTAVAEVVSTTATTFTVDPKVVAASSAATLTVVDSLGANKTAAITVTPLSSSLGINPSTLAVTNGTLNIQFNIIGGFAPYDIYTSDTSVLTLDGGPAAIYDQAATSFTADAVGSGTATVTVVDNDGKSVTSTITTTGFSIVLSSVTVNEGNSVIAQVYGGDGGPYTVTSSEASRAYDSAPGDGTWVVAASGNTFVINTSDINAGAVITLTATDSSLNITTATLTIDAD